MLTNGPFLRQLEAVGSIFRTYSTDLVRCLASPSKDISRSCINAAFESANQQGAALCHKPFTGDWVVYEGAYGHTSSAYFFDRPHILNWLQTSVPEQLVSRKRAAINMVNNDFAHYGKCLQEKCINKKFACRDKIRDELRNALTEQWRPLLTTTTDVEKCREYHNQYYTAWNNTRLPGEDFDVLARPFAETPCENKTDVPAGLDLRFAVVPR